MLVAARAEAAAQLAPDPGRIQAKLLQQRRQGGPLTPQRRLPTVGERQPAQRLGHEPFLEAADPDEQVLRLDELVPGAPRRQAPGGRRLARGPARDDGRTGEPPASGPEGCGATEVAEAALDLGHLPARQPAQFLVDGPERLPERAPADRREARPSPQEIVV